MILRASYNLLLSAKDEEPGVTVSLTFSTPEYSVAFFFFFFILVLSIAVVASRSRMWN